MAGGPGLYLFAYQQGRPFVTGPFLGGYVFVLTGAVAAAGTVAIPIPFKAKARSAFVLTCQDGATYPSRVVISTSTASTATVKFESAQPIGTAVFLV